MIFKALRLAYCNSSKLSKHTRYLQCSFVLRHHTLQINHSSSQFHRWVEFLRNSSALIKLPESRGIWSIKHCPATPHRQRPPSAHPAPGHLLGLSCWVRRQGSQGDWSRPSWEASAGPAFLAGHHRHQEDVPSSAVPRRT